jgi:hypothetical protein
MIDIEEGLVLEYQNRPDLAGFGALPWIGLMNRHPEAEIQVA